MEMLFDEGHHSRYGGIFGNFHSDHGRQLGVCGDIRTCCNRNVYADAGRDILFLYL